MSGLLGGDGADVAATTVAAIMTLIVLGGLLGERRLFGWSQHLLAGLATGFLAVLAIGHVIGPRLVAPLVQGGVGRGELWLGLGLVAVTAAAPWLPRRVAAVPISIAIGALAAFALGGAVVGTLLPQVVATVPGPASDPGAAAVGVAGAAITLLVLAGFVRGVPANRALRTAAGAGRWVMLAGIGGWLGYLLVSRLVLLVDRVGFLIVDWLGIAR
jgi:hypothetical protein